MSKQNTQIDFSDAYIPTVAFALYEHVIEDRGSRYSVSIGHVQNRDNIKAFIKKLKSNKKYRKATHNSWAARISKDGVLYETKNDDGEVGAGNVILRIMQKENITNCVICVTRWFGGTKLMNDRFKHLQNAAKYAIDHMDIS